MLTKVADALQVRLDELLASPRTPVRHLRAAELPTRQRGAVKIRKLLPEPLAGLDLERLVLPPGARMAGVPHGPGTREYLACERGVLSPSSATSPNGVMPATSSYSTAPSAYTSACRVGAAPAQTSGAM